MSFIHIPEDMQEKLNDVMWLYVILISMVGADYCYSAADYDCLKGLVQSQISLEQFVKTVSGSLPCCGKKYEVVLKKYKCRYCL